MVWLLLSMMLWMLLMADDHALQACLQSPWPQNARQQTLVESLQRQTQTGNAQNRQPKPRRRH